MTVTHDEIGELAAERYLLHEMIEEERDAFEEHYADCIVCADEVQSVYAFRDGVRSTKLCQDNVVEFRPQGWRRFAAPLMAAAALIIAVLTMWIGVAEPLRSRAASLRAEVAESRQPYAPVYQHLRAGAVRGVGPQLSAASAVRLGADINGAPTGSTITCIVFDAKGQRQGKPMSVPSTDITIDNTVTVILPPHALHPGQYSLHIDGINPPAPPYPFTVVPVPEGERQ